MKKILVTGGAGYIGSHTLVDLIENGFEVISADNNVRSSPEIFIRVEKITGKKIKNYKIDLCNYDDCKTIFNQHSDIAGVIHFAAFKAVGESVEKPLLYFQNNLGSLITILRCIEDFKIPYFVFSSSCTVYGNADIIPVTENTPRKEAASPYGLTKQMGEQIIEAFSSANKFTKSIMLRYFNPAGAHPTGLIGELPIDKPQNLTPILTQTAIGKLPGFVVFGNDYNTRDGSCVRDFIHVCDLANAHTKALQYMLEGKSELPCEVFNLGTGRGITVLEAIDTFEKSTGIKLNYTIGERREGDVIAIFANNDKAKSILNWEAKYTVPEIMLTAWKWEQALIENPVTR